MTTMRLTTLMTLGLAMGLLANAADPTVGQVIDQASKMTDRTAADQLLANYVAPPNRAFTTDDCLKILAATQSFKAMASTLGPCSFRVHDSAGVIRLAQAMQERFKMVRPEITKDLEKSMVVDYSKTATPPLSGTDCSALASTPKNQNLKLETLINCANRMTSFLGLQILVENSETVLGALANDKEDLERAAWKRAQALHISNSPACQSLAATINRLNRISAVSCLSPGAPSAPDGQGTSHSGD